MRERWSDRINPSESEFDFFHFFFLFENEERNNVDFQERTLIFNHHMSAKVTVAAAPSARDGDGHLKGGTSKEAEVEGAAAAAGHLKTRVGLDLESQVREEKS